MQTSSNTKSHRSDSCRPSAATSCCSAAGRGGSVTTAASAAGSGVVSKGAAVRRRFAAPAPPSALFFSISLDPPTQTSSWGQVTQCPGPARLRRLLSSTHREGGGCLLKLPRGKERVLKSTLSVHSRHCSLSQEISHQTPYGTVPLGTTQAPI